MQSKRRFSFRVLALFVVLCSSVAAGFAGVSRAIQEQYKRDYENKAMFLKIPIFAERQFVYISGQSYRIEPGNGSPRFKVGDQLRIISMEFSGDEVRFKMSGITNAGLVEITYKFDTGLQESFPNRDVFDRAIQSTLTEGLRYKDIDEAKDNFVTDQFERSVREIAGSASISRESVLKSIAPHIPAFQDAQREIDSLKNRVQEISAQLNQAQTENRKLESDSRAQQAELSRLKSANVVLQEKIDSSSAQIAKLGDELRDVRGNRRDLTTQVTELGQSMKKLQKDNEGLGNQVSALKTNLAAQQATNGKLLSENEDLKTKTQKMQATISTLTSNEDSLGRKYLDLKNEKEKLDDYSQLIAALRTRVVEESTGGGIYKGKANVYLRNTLLGSLDWNFPTYLNHGESKSCAANFSSESIDYVRLTPEERHLLRTLGNKWKLQMDLNSGAETMEVKPETSEPFHEVGEREHSSWRWNVSNNGTQDARVVLTAYLLNNNSARVSIMQQDHPLMSSNAVRQFRGYLQPVPLVVGAVLGFLLFGIVGIFRGKHRPTPRHQNAHPSESEVTVKKQL